MRFSHLKPGDSFTRLLGGELPMAMIVLSVDENVIHARAADGPDGYKFCRATGAEIDEDLQWGPAFGRTGSFIKPETVQ